MFRGHKSVGAYKNALVRVQDTRPITKVFLGGTDTGKSWKCRELASGAKKGPDGQVKTRPYWTMPTPPSSGHIPWIDGYNGEEDVVLEDFSGEINFRTLLRMLDTYPIPMQVKGGMVNFRPKRIYISTNVHPNMWYHDHQYLGGPLERRLETRGSSIIEMNKKFKF